jgi:tRNA U34 5-methylaminomethyl-2-thiouridine-forming methyltransferase MnmC
MTLHSNTFGVTYHSAFGAVEESLHVFLCAGFHRMVLNEVKQLDILEIGFGTGLNALLTLFETNKNQDLSVNYTAVEAYPIDVIVQKQLQYVEYLKRPHLQAHFDMMHQAKEEETVHMDNFHFKRLTKKFEDLSEVDAYNIIFYDAFAPTTQPELWELPMMQKMYDSLKLGGLLVTYCAKGSFKRALKASGFELEALPGPGKKREMTRAWKKT